MALFISLLIVPGFFLFMLQAILQVGEPHSWTAVAVIGCLNLLNLTLFTYERSRARRGIAAVILAASDAAGSPGGSA